MARPTVIAGRYRLDAPLGRGGFKAVWRAHDLLLKRDLALALYHGAAGGSSSGHAEVLREARALARLGDNPRIVTVFDVGDHEGVPFVTTRLMTGGDLVAAIEAAPTGRLAPARAIPVMSDVLEALTAAHAARIVHRDVAPNNIWLDGAGRAVLGDFGIAAGGAAGPTSYLAEAAGKFPYMAPELFQDKPATFSTDLYAAGCTLYELLTGAPPFTGDPGAVMQQHIGAPPVPPSRRAPGIPPALDAAVLALLTKRPADRPRSATDASNRLRAAMVADPPPSQARTRAAPVASQAPTRPSAAPPIGGSPPARPTERVPGPPLPSGGSKRWPFIGLGVAGALLAAFAVLVVLLGARSEGGSGGTVAQPSPTRPSGSGARVARLQVFNNVFERREGSFEAGESVAACFAHSAGSPRSWLTLLVLKGATTPVSSVDPRAVARTEPLTEADGPQCHAVGVVDEAQRLPPGPYILWVLRGEERLESKAFKVTGGEVAQQPAPTPPPATPPPTPAPTASPTPTPRPTWMVVSGLPPEPWQCLAVRGQPQQEPALDCLTNGTIVQVTGEPRVVGGTRWWPVSGGWMAEDYLAPSRTPPSERPSDRSSTDTARLFYQYLGEQRWPAAYHLLSGRRRREEPYGTWLKGVETFKAVTLVSIVPPIASDVLTVVWDVSEELGGRASAPQRRATEWQLTRERGEWRLDVGQRREPPTAPPVSPTLAPTPPPTPAPTATPRPSPTRPPATQSLPTIATPRPASPTAQPPLSTLSGQECLDVSPWRVNPGSFTDEVLGEVSNSCGDTICVRVRSIVYRDSAGNNVGLSEHYSGSSVRLSPGDRRPFRFEVRPPSMRTPRAELDWAVTRSQNPGPLFCL